MTVVVPWLDPGLEFESGEFSRSGLMDLKCLDGLELPIACLDPSYPLRLLAIELPLLRPGVA